MLNSKNCSKNIANVLELNNIDLLGQRFNGYSLQKYINQHPETNLSANMLVNYKLGHNKHVKNIFNNPNHKTFDWRIETIEQNLNIKNQISITEEALMLHPLFQQADILHFHMYHNMHLPIEFLMRIPKEKQIVIEMHDTFWLTDTKIPMLEVFNYADNVNKKSLDAQRKRVLNSIDAHFIVHSPFMLNLAKKSSATNKLNIELIHFGINTNIFKPIKNTKNLRKKYRLNKEDIVLFCRSQKEFKGISYILEALKLLPDTKQNIVIITVAAKNLLNPLKNKYRIIEFGSVKNEYKMSELYNLCDIFLAPSTEESFGFMAAEAMSCGKPVIVFDGTALPHTVNAPKIGISVKRNSKALMKAILQLINNPNERFYRGKLGREFVLKTYNEQLYFDQYIKLFKKLSKKGPRHIIKPPKDNIPTNLPKFLPFLQGETIQSEIFDYNNSFIQETIYNYNHNLYSKLLQQKKPNKAYSLLQNYTPTIIKKNLIKFKQYGKKALILFIVSGKTIFTKVKHYIKTELNPEKLVKYLKTTNTAFFSTCNDAYIPNSITSLLSIRKFIPDASLYIFSRNISEENKMKLDQNHIKYFDLDLRGRFYRQWNYPAECYYIFAGPEILLKEGFKYSVYIDGDILCIKNPLKNIGSIKGLAGSAIGNCRGVFLDDFDAIKQLFNLNEEQSNRPRIISSVVYFNNEKMHNIKLLDIATKYFKQCLEHDIPRKGDDSLLSLIQLTTLYPEEIKNIPHCSESTPLTAQKHNLKKTIFIHFAKDKPWNKSKDSNDIHRKYIYSWRKIFIQHSISTWDKNYQQNKLIEKQNSTKKEEARLESLSKSGLVLPATKREENYHKKPLKIFVCENRHTGIVNFGDEVQKDIIPLIFGFKIIPCSDAKEAELFSVGSILFSLPLMNIKKNIYIWGSGFISKEKVIKEEEIIPKIHFAAVRGQYTLQRINKIAKTELHIPLGDPGLLANIVFPENPNKTDKIGIVHHYIDADNPIVEKLRNNKKFLIINPLDSPKEVASQISSCKFIVSSSLHGLIFADSYRIPNAHIHFSDKVYGGEYKFKDYDSGIGKSHLEFDIDKIFDEEYIKQLIKQYKPIDNLETIQRNLIDTFPYK